MIALGASSVPPHLPPSREGFSWWYVDLCGPEGEAVVLIWARGLPFVPETPARARAEQHSIVVAVYEEGRESFYALQTFEAPGSAGGAGPSELRLGRSSLRVHRRGSKVFLRADLDLDVTGTGRVRGSVELVGDRARVATEGGGPLGWAPVVCAGRGRASLRWDDGSYAAEGRAYFDGNASDRPLGALGLRDWRWGRLALPGRDLVYFQLEPEGDAGTAGPVVLSVAEDGAVRAARGARASFRDGLPGWFGLRRAESLTLTADDLPPVHVDFVHQVEDGPFYQRYLVQATTPCGQTGRGVAERVVPSRLDRAWHRPLVEMRIERVGARSSSWLPLFSGPRAGRAGRLVSAWLRAPDVRKGASS